MYVCVCNALKEAHCDHLVCLHADGQYPPELMEAFQQFLAMRAGQGAGGGQAQQAGDLPGAGPGQKISR